MRLRFMILGKRNIWMWSDPYPGGPQLGAFFLPCILGMDRNPSA